MTEESSAIPCLSEFISLTRGHFLLESGHHGELWLDLELLFSRPARLKKWVDELAARLRQWPVDVVCGPLNEGAFLGLQIASALDVDFVYTEAFQRTDAGQLFPVGYRLSGALREKVRGRKVVIVNDVINAGSAVRGTHADLVEQGAIVTGIGVWLTLGDSAAKFAKEQQLKLETLAAMPNPLWRPENCPLCAAGIPLQKNSRG
jgi:orotate phosphoribosyltransferase